MNETIPVMAVVLAAGKSSRMGSFKPLMPIKDTPMLAVTIRKLLIFPFEKIVCITGHQHQTLQTEIQVEDRRFAWAYNPNYTNGQSTSLKVAAACCPTSIQAIMIFLADQPFIEPSTINRILIESRKTNYSDLKCIIQPSFREQKGHPVFFSKLMLVHFPELEGDVGAKMIMKYAQKHVLVPVEDEGIILDLDTTEDYQKYC